MPECSPPMMPAIASGFCVVGDQGRIRRRRHGLFVQQKELLAGLWQAHMDRPREFGIVEGVQRLTEFEHHVVGDVNQEGNRADAAALDAPLHPLRRRGAGIDAADDAAAVARARSGGIEHHLARVGQRSLLPA